MSLILVGLSHKTAPVEVREKLAFSREELAELHRGLRSVASIAEGLILSTCNRTEVLASCPGSDTEEAIAGIRGFLCAARGLERSEMDRHLYAHTGLEAVRHLFRVASSLDSMMVGEPQILGQVKEAYSVAAQAGSLGVGLERVMQEAFRVAKRVRADTQISRNPVSISYAAVELAHKIFGSLAGRSIMLLGAGKMAELAARHLTHSGARSVLVSSRTFHHAQEMAKRFNGLPIAIDDFKKHLLQVDIVISSTTAPGHILGLEDGQKLMKERRGRAIFFIDIAVPRDIDPRLNDLDNLYLYNVDDLQAVVEAGLQERRREAVLAEAIVEEEVTHFHGRSRAREAAPAIVSLRNRMHAMAEDELGRFRSRMGPLSEKQETLMREMVASVVNKILHGPTREMKRNGAVESGQDAIGLVRRMFDLPDERPEQDEEEAPRQALDEGRHEG